MSTKKKPNDYWTKSRCADIASTFSHRSDFQYNEKGAYLKARKENWLDDICTHMVAKPYKKSPHKNKNKNLIDLTGKRFEKWLVLEYVKIEGKPTAWRCKCDCGTEKILASQNLREGNSTSCNNCSNQVSKAVRTMFNYIQELGFKDAILSDRSRSLELDIVVPSANFCIEYDGLIWHSSKFRVTENTEKERYRKIKATGLTCFRIFEDEWLRNKVKILNMIKHRLVGSNKPKLNEFNIQLIEKPSKYRQFFEDNHIDGYGNSLFGWGIFQQDKLVSCMTFRKYTQGKFKGQLELARFCSSQDINAYGCFGKLLKVAKKHAKEQGYTHIVSASDNRLSDGKVYINNGFTEEVSRHARLNYYYYLHARGERIHRQRCQKLKPPKITQEEYNKHPTELMQANSGLMAKVKFGIEQPLYRIWGWGTRLWVLTLK